MWPSWWLRSCSISLDCLKDWLRSDFTLSKTWLLMAERSHMSWFCTDSLRPSCACSVSSVPACRACCRLTSSKATCEVICAAAARDGEVAPPLPALAIDSCRFCQASSSFVALPLLVLSKTLRTSAAASAAVTASAASTSARLKRMSSKSPASRASSALSSACTARTSPRPLCCMPCVAFTRSRSVTTLPCDVPCSERSSLTVLPCWLLIASSSMLVVVCWPHSASTSPRTWPWKVSSCLRHCSRSATLCALCALSASRRAPSSSMACGVACSAERRSLSSAKAACWLLAVSPRAGPCACSTLMALTDFTCSFCSASTSQQTRESASSSSFRSCCTSLVIATRAASTPLACWRAISARCARCPSSSRRTSDSVAWCSPCLVSKRWWYSSKRESTRDSTLFSLASQLLETRVIISMALPTLRSTRSVMISSACTCIACISRMTSDSWVSVTVGSAPCCCCSSSSWSKRPSCTVLNRAVVSELMLSLV
mmetsp:Transcript_1315/g.3318  ORF Transcript_1315/g.3318 Transcript_1315/m.3318 type:complete len:486 (-) Transcript_1315:192-1649(-)